MMATLARNGLMIDPNGILTPFRPINLQLALNRFTVD